MCAYWFVCQCRERVNSAGEVPCQLSQWARGRRSPNVFMHNIEPVNRVIPVYLDHLGLKGNKGGCPSGIASPR